MSDILPANFRDISTIATEIKMIQGEVRRTALEGAIEIGRRLVEAKELLGHGEWGTWLKEEFAFSQSSASRCMQLFKEYGADQQSLFGAESKYSTLNNLSVSNALRLIAIPAEEREEFAEANDVEHLSARELDALIEQRISAEREKARVAEAEKAEAHEELDKLTDKYAALSAAAREQEKELKAAQADVSASIEAAKKEAEKARRAAEKAQKAAEAEAKKARAEAEAAKKDLQQLRDNPEIPQEVLDKLKAQFGKAAEEAEARAREAEAKLKVADPDVAMFKLHFDSLQKTATSMRQLIIKMKNTGNAETADKLSRAACAALERAKEELA